MNAVNDAKDKLLSEPAQDAILELALWFEAAGK